MTLSVSKLPWYGQVGAFALVAALAAGAYFHFYDGRYRAEIATKQQQLGALRADIARGRGLAARLPEFRTQVADLEARLDGLKAVLPEQKDVGDLLRRLQTLAAQSNLEIRGFKPQPIAQKAMHAEWPIALEIEGSYHDLGLFFDKVSRVPRIINISGIGIKARNQAGRPAAGATPTATISARCTATTFVLSEAPPPPAKGQKPAAKPAVKR
jgi:type IV pilus assembly protein PilO